MEKILLQEIENLRGTLRPLLKYAKENLPHNGTWCKQVVDAEKLLDVCSCSPHHTKEDLDKNLCEPCNKPIHVILS